MTTGRIGRYTIVRPLGSGGMGEVYEGFDEQLRRPVAIKGLHHDRATVEQRERLLREALSAAALSHPAVAHVYEIVSQDGRDWLVMEHVSGASLAQHLVSGPFHPGEVARIGEAVASALADAHRHGIIHRDVKPENVMLTPDGHVKVLDFGLAKWTGMRAEGGDTLTRDGLVVGTTKAMSPEQALGKPLDHRSDIFSLGSLLYELACGKPAFRGETPMETMVKVSRVEFEPLASVAPALPGALAEVIERCMKLSPAKRYQSAQAVADALRPVSRGTALTLEAHVPAGLTGLARRVRRHWRAAAIAAPLVAALAGLAVVKGWFSSERPLVVAVLPVTATGGGETGLASAAVADAIAGQLTRVAGIAVIAGREVRSVAGADRSAKDIARELGADELVEATVTHVDPAGPTRVSLSRVDGETGRVSWSQQLDVGSADLLVLEDRISTALADGFAGFRVAAGGRPREVSEESLRDYLEVRSRMDGGRSSPTYAEERALLERAVRGSPRFLEAILALADLHRYFFTTTLRGQDRARAEELIAQARTIAPREPAVVLSEVEFLLAIGKSDEAAGLSRSLTRERPGDAKAWAAYGRALSGGAEHGAAEKALRRAIALQPSWANYYDLADVLRAEGDLPGARAALAELLERAPENAHGLSKLAEIALQAGEFAAAEPVLRTLIAVRGSGLDLSNLGTCLLYLGRADEAVPTFERASRESPDDLLIRASLGDALLWSGRRDEALEHYAAALIMAEAQAAEGEAIAYVQATRAVCLAHLGRGTEAVIAVTDALREAPDDSYTVFVAALVAAVAGDETAALAWTRKAVELHAPKAWFSGPEFAGLRGDPAFGAALGGRP
ncbi:MAG: protein kinase domain-containing protein [Acidobacteriota bacterium]